MIQQEASVPRILGLEKPNLVGHEILYYVRVSRCGKGDEPGAAGQNQHEEIHCHVFPAEVQPEPGDNEPYCCAEAENEECHRSLGYDGQPHEQGAQGGVAHAMRLLALVRIFREKVNGQEYAQVEPGVDYAGLEIEEGEEGNAVHQRPQRPEACTVFLPAYIEQRQQRNDAYHGIRETGGELVHSENLHANGLRPDEQRRFFPKRLEVDLYVEPVARKQHLAGRLGEVDLVPVEQPHVPDPGDEKRGPEQDNEDIYPK